MRWDSIEALIEAATLDTRREEGWTIRLADKENTQSVFFDHELSMSFWFRLSGEERDTQRLAEFLARNEFVVIGARPGDMPNSVFIGEFRKAMGGMKSPNDAVAATARLLGIHGFLTEPEAVWLEGAGGAWNES